MSAGAPNSKWVKWLAAAVVVLTLAGGAWWYGRKAWREITGTKVETVPVAKVLRGDVTLDVTARGELRGGAFTAVINFIEKFGRVRGAAFPSEHVAGSIAALWDAWRHRKWLFWVLLPLVLCMCVSTVWGRYHCLVDVFGGMITGTLGCVIGKRLMNPEKSARGETNTKLASL